MALINTLKRAFGLSAEVDEDDFDDMGFNALGYERSSRPERRAEATRPSAPSAPVIPSVSTPAAPEPAAAGTGGSGSPGEIERLKEVISRISAERDAAQQARLSAERQKRALTDRLYDLESRLSESETDRENLYAENKRLEVRLKRALPGGNVADDAVLDNSEEIKVRDEEIASLKDALAEARKEGLKLKHDMEAVKMKSDLAEVMVSELQTQAATSKRELEAANKALEATNNTLEALRRQQSVPRAKDGNEELKMQYELRIAELQRVVSLKEKEIRSLNSTIEHNLRRHAENEALMRSEIASLRKGVIPEPASAPADDNPAPALKVSADDGSDLPRKAKKMFRKKKQNKKSKASDDDAQMSLW